MTVDEAVTAIEHPDDRVRLEAARVLAASDEPRAQAALETRWDDASAVVSRVALRAAVFRDLEGVWQRFLPHVQAVLDRRNDTPIEERIVSRLLYVCHGGEMPRRVDPDPLVAEPRLLDLAARLRRHPTVGASARMVLEVAPRERALAAIDRYPYVPVLARIGLPESRDYVARYLGGERAVWDEVVAQGLAIAQHAELRDEALAVACEIMKRVREVATPATLPATDADLAPFVERFGPLPVALEALWRVIGAVDLGPGRTIAGAGQLAGALAEYDAKVAATHVEIVGPFDLPVTMHGSIELPPRDLASAVDPQVDGHGVRLVELLRVWLRAPYQREADAIEL